jgi:hypothetical protein
VSIDLSAAVVSVTWRAIGTHQTLAVFEDRTAWYWALATVGAGADVVGSFRAAVPPERFAAATAMATAAVGREADAAPGALGMTVTSAEHRGWVPLGTTEADDLAAVVLPLVASARAQPIAAAQLQTHVATAPTGQRIAGFTLTSVGERPLSLRFDPQTFVLTAGDGGATLLPAPRMGLVDAGGRLLDGLYQAAQLAPGVLGACTIVLAEAPPAPLARGAVQGWLTLEGPWDEAPIEDFEASSPVQLVAR